MTTQTTKIENGTIVLPREMNRVWQGADVFVQADSDSIYIKRLSPTNFSLSEMMTMAQKAAKRANISQKTAEDVLRKTRKVIYTKQ